ncbi:hypothetical protein PybrP1_012322 [[Pythium] brassicae (nom. inval.)]|nr:hypothetical protein PybrP1_012322 [[Pythium] brassicae (nom. inval.)]
MQRDENKVKDLIVPVVARFCVSDRPNNLKKRHAAEDDEDAELEQEALAEWLARGLAVQDFTLDKMLRLWMEEDGGEDDEDDAEDALAAKQELIQQSYNVLAPALAHAREYASEVRDAAVVEAKHLWAVAKHYAELPPLRRRRLLREHVRDVRHMDAESAKYALVRRRVQDALEDAQSADTALQFGRKKRNRHRAPLLARVRELTRDADNEATARVRADAERERQERTDRALQETQDARDARKQAAAAQLASRRQRNVRFWRKQHADAKAFAEQQARAQEATASEVLLRLEQQQQQQCEAERVAQAASDDDDDDDDCERVPSSSLLGVFGTPLAPGEWHSAVDGDHRIGLDEHTIGVATTHGYAAEREVTRIELLEARSKAALLQEKLAQAAHVRAELLHDRRMVHERREQVLEEVAFLTAEHDDLSRDLAGPPRRDPNDADKTRFHVLVTRRAAQKQQLADLDARLANLRKREDIIARSEQAFAPLLAAAQASEARLQQVVDGFEEQRHDLPVVVGRSIFKPSGADAALQTRNSDADAVVTDPITDPNALLAHVTLQSKLELLKSAAVPAQEHYKAARRLAAERWRWSEHKVLAQHELDVTTTQLAAARDRFVAQHKASLRADLVQAITRYHQGGTKLRPCIIPLKGFVQWWECRAPAKSVNVVSSDALGGVCLEQPHSSGQLKGRVRFPKRAAYRLQLLVRLQRPDEVSRESAPAPVQDEPLEETASIASRDLRVFVGSDYDALQELSFRDAGEQALRTGSRSFDFFGTQLCFCFAFRVRSDEALPLVLSHVGSYEERLEDFRDEEQRMRRQQQQETHFVSELVKTMRLQATPTSSERCTALLKELLDVEQSRTKCWDSALLHGHAQRFDRAAYAAMLRAEIKKEVTRQIDDDVVVRKARGADAQDATSESVAPSSADASRMNFLARKFALVEPQLLKAKEALGDYCGFKAPASDAVAGPTSGVRNASVVLGLRFEWREAKSKLLVTHKPGAAAAAPTEAVGQWCSLGSANVVFLASAFPTAIKRKREAEATARALSLQQHERIQELETETLKTELEEQDALQRERSENRALAKQKAEDLARRQTKLYWDAIRLTTYSESVSAQIDFQVQRRLNALAQEADSSDDTLPPLAARAAVERDVKAAYAAQFVEGRLALASKTWERKERRTADKREAARRERAFRIRQDGQRAEEIAAESTQALAALDAERERQAATQLQIPNFQLAVNGAFACEHRDVKSWGSKYDTGMRCKQCGKEMAKSFDEPHHSRGADPALDADVQAQRGHEAGGPALRFTSSAHFAAVESERVRLEKEARAIQLTDAVLYDRRAPKAIDAFNFRHGFDRGVALTVAGADPLYARAVHDAHHAAFQDVVLYHGRLRNFHVRIQQLSALHAHVTTLLAAQREFLETVHVESAFVLEKLPLVERDHARAMRLLAEDDDARQRLDDASRELAAAQRERAAASHAIVGVEEDAEFAESHVPALVSSSDEMRAVLERLEAQRCAAAEKLAASSQQLASASAAKAATDGLLSHLMLRTPGTLVRTAFGLSTTVYYRDEDGCVVLSPLRWRATFFVPAAQLVALEHVFREEERVAMAWEEAAQRRFYEAEARLAKRERERMRLEDDAIRALGSWRATQERDEAVVRRALEAKELALQLQYELEGRKRSCAAAATEAARLHAFARVSLKRPRRAAVWVRPSRLEIARVARACEKRLAMASVEATLAGANAELRGGFARARDAALTSQVASDVFAELLASIGAEICAESLQDAAVASTELLRSLSTAVVPLDDSWTVVHTHTLLGFDRAWAARKQRHAVVHATWQREAAKLSVLKREIARREEFRRLVEAERARLERRRQAMLAEERRCRQFYVDEMVQCMRERKAMAHTELETREFLRQLALEAMKTKYAKMVDDRSHASDKAARRLEIKLGKNEQHRLHREWALAKREDELATQLRERELARAQAEALERQFDRYLLQQAIDGKVAAALEASHLQERVREAQRRAAEEQAAFAAKLTQERMAATVTTFAALAGAEGAWMHAVERAAYWLRTLAPLARAVQQLRPELARIIQARVDVVADATLKRAHARHCRERLASATTALKRAIQSEDQCAKSYRKIHAANATMDSEVLHGRPQRFSTTYLREQLHGRYFRLLTESVVRRALVACSEREVARLEAQLRQVHDERVVKSQEVGRLKRKHRRAFHYSLRRAELGKLLFGGAQRRLLHETFQQWARLWSQRVVVRASFELKHRLLLQQHQLNQANAALAAAPAKRGIGNPTKLSTMLDHQKRRVQCRLCRCEYSEAQNHRDACAYHPAAYELACVRSCASRRVGERGAVATVAASCMLHRARRWLCCDETDEGRFGSNGCARRYHMPARANPALAQLVARKTQQEAVLLEQIDQQLLELRERNVVGRMKAGAKAVVAAIERDLAEKRSIAAKYTTFGRR